jgi:hypothetical protein
LNCQLNGEYILFSAQLEQLRIQNIRTQGYRFAKSTRTNVLSQIRQWLYYALYFRATILPASALHLCLFMELMGNTSGYQHCKNVLSGVKFLHGATDNSFPENDFLLKTTLQGLKRKLAGTPKQVLPVDPAVLRRMYQFVDTRKLSDLSAWCGFLLAFFCLFRKANLCPKDSDNNPAMVLKRGDVEIDEELGQVLVYVNFSKTNQFMRRSHVILTQHLTCTLTCEPSSTELNPVLSHQYCHTPRHSTSITVHSRRSSRC